MNRFLILLFFLVLACESCKSARLPLAHESVHWDSCGYKIGDHACNFSLTDRNGNNWELYESYGSVIVLDFSTGWCGACRRAASDIQELQDEKQKIISFFYVSIMLEDRSSFSPPSLRFLNEWASSYQITTAPILSADASIASEENWNVSSLPTFYILNRDLVITDIVVGYNKHNLENAINRAIESI